MFNGFGEQLKIKVLYITEDKLYERLQNIITTKVSTYKDLDDVSRVYEKYVPLISVTKTSGKPYALYYRKVGYMTSGVDEVSEILFMKYVMDRIPNYDRTKRIDFNRFRKTLRLIYETDKPTIDAVADEFRRHYDLEISLNVKRK